MSTSFDKNQPRIAIVGAGPGGLTLALILQRHGVKPVVYESEPSRTSRDQGGSLDLHPESGQKALQAAGLYDQFQAIARYEGEDFRLFDKNGCLYMDEKAEDEQGGRPEIDRGTLRDLLLNALDPACIRWGHKLHQAIPREDGRHELHFENGHTDTVDLVVGADGAFSRIRPLLTDAVPAYTGLSMVELNVRDAAVSHPDLAAFNGRGKLFALGDHKGILAQLNGDGGIRVYASFEAERDWLDTCGIPFDQPEEAQRQLLMMFSDWDESLREYIRQADGAILPRRIYMLPVGLTWEHKPGVTLIGDAAHLMSPFAGEGANLAMLDAAELALSIVGHADLNKAVQAYEEKMYSYSKPSAEDSYDNLKLCFSDNAASNLKELMHQLHEHPEIEG
ncbi:FAD-dependent monooxygenase [Tumebacillus sp. ITR2]|uniref:Flavin-dependent monooxygenase n=1 Tax=Tumebacillus amylolyticus TaxID=2801339 RepID=A0ABS1JB02_9BACL|nr:NAD(P)/FAD-dependent oxidoreductase [Tumebacillus amylolyticus]MBL0387452.1 FAD-dependent monooxygenase [Tumebacillus amylolyticus]